MIMSATVFIRHAVADFTSWSAVYAGAEPVRVEHGCISHQVLQSPTDHDDVMVTLEFPSVKQAEAFTGDPELAAAMHRAGVRSVPRIEIFERA
jgi:quinol monooxygenase YgiN